MNQAMVAWFKHVNSTGGVQGHPIKVDTRDDAYQATEAVTNTKAFIAEHVIAVTGQCGSIQPPAQLPLLQAAHIPFLFVFGSCTPCESDSMYFNLMPGYGSQLQAAIPWVFQHKGTGSVIVMTTSTPGAAQITSEVQAVVTKDGGTNLASYSAPSSTADMTPFVLKMKALNPDYVVLNMTPQQAAVLTKAMTAQNFTPKKFLVGSSAIAQAAFLTNVAPSLQPKVLVTSDVIPPSAAPGTQCDKVLTAAHIAVTAVTLRGCGTAQVDVAALDQAKPLTSAGLVSALDSWKNVKASDIYPPITFSATRRVGVAASSCFVFGVQGGQFVKVGQL